MLHVWMFVRSSWLNIAPDVGFGILWAFIDVQAEVGGVSVGLLSAGSLGSDAFSFLCRAFKINELKTEVTNRLAMLEKRVERKCTLDFPLRAAGRLLIGTSGSRRVVVHIFASSGLV